MVEISSDAPYGANVYEGGPVQKHGQVVVQMNPAFSV